MNAVLAPEPLIFVDLETSGANFANDRIIEIGGVELVDDAPVLVLDYVEGANLAELVRDWRKSAQPATAPAARRSGANQAMGKRTRRARLRYFTGIFPGWRRTGGFHTLQTSRGVFP